MQRLAFQSWRGVAGSKGLRPRSLILMAALIPACGGCAVVAVADAAVTVAATTVKVGAKVVGAAVDAVIPESTNTEKK